MPETRNYILEEILNSIKIDIKDIQINTLQIKVDYIKNNKIIKIEQKIFIVGLEEMLNNLDFEENLQFGIDFTYKIIPKSFKPFKLMAIYNIQNKISIPNSCFNIFQI